MIKNIYLLFVAIALMFSNVLHSQEQAGTELTQIWNGAAWDNYLRDTYVFITDTNNNCLVSEIHNWYWQANNWTENSRSYLTYDANFVLQTKLSQFYNGEVNNWENNYFETYTYLPNGNLESSTLQTFEDSEWVNLNLKTYSYNASGTVDLYTFQLWNTVSLEWTNGQQEINTYDANDNLTHKLIQSWNEDIGEWVNQYDNVYSYTNSLLTNKIEQAWQVGTDEWVNSHNYTYAYDANSNLATNTIQNWNASDSVWVNQGKLNYSYITTSGQQLQEVLFQFWTASSSSWTNSTKTIFSDYCIGNSIAELNSISSFNLYPNPGINLSISIYSRVNESMELSIYDISGKLILQQRHNLAVGNNILPILTANLTSGEYLVKVETKNIVTTKNWVKL
jgi:Secretion system C-terminal sorting domain